MSVEGLKELGEAARGEPRQDAEEVGHPDGRSVAMLKLPVCAGCSMCRTAWPGCRMSRLASNANYRLLSVRRGVEYGTNWCRLTKAPLSQTPHVDDKHPSSGSKD